MQLPAGLLLPAAKQLCKQLSEHDAALRLWSVLASATVHMVKLAKVVSQMQSSAMLA